MRLVQFVYKDRPDDVRIGYMDGCCVVDINSREQYVPNTMLGFLQNADIHLSILNTLKKKYNACTTSMNEIILKAPVHGMDKVLGLCENYTDYCEQTKVTLPSQPNFFRKFSSSIIGPNDSIKIRTAITQQVDWGVELCVVIGKNASLVKADDAYKYVFGYTIAQDITARDWIEKNGNNFLLSKSMDTFCPIGPWIVTADEIEDPDNLKIKCYVNGKIKQRSKTSKFVFKIPQIIERITSIMTLLPGDIILTGTPAGVGMYKNPPVFLHSSDVISSEIEKIGVFETRVQKYVQPEEYYDYKLQNRCYITPSEYETHYWDILPD